MKADYIIRVGESLSLSLLVIEGDIADIDSVNAVLKVAGPNGSVPPFSAPIIETFDIDLVEAPDVGWTLTIPNTRTALLKPGFYITNAKLNLMNGTVTKTETIIIEVRGSVT